MSTPESRRARLASRRAQGRCTRCGDKLPKDHGRFQCSVCLGQIKLYAAGLKPESRLAIRQAEAAKSPNRCRCGLLKPCHACPSIYAYASRRDGSWA
jgi:hypothetical protein